MSRLVVLLVCSVLVLYLLHLDSKRARGASRGLWVATVWMLSVSSKPLGLWFGIYGDPEGGSPLDRTFLIFLLLLGLMVLVGRRSSWRSVASKNVWLVLVLSYMLTSILWSAIPGTSFKRWTRELLAIVMAFVVATEQSPRRAMETVLRRVAYVLVPFSLLLVKYFPEYGVEYGRWSGTRMWIGVATQKNGLGRLCLIAVFFLLWSLIKDWKARNGELSRHHTYADLLVLVMALYLITGGIFSVPYSATAISALAVGVSLFGILLWLKRLRIDVGRKTLAAIMIAVISYGTVIPFAGGLSVGVGLTSALGRDTTLTGRTGVWSSLIPAVLERSLVGSGVGAFWTYRTRLIYNISDSHSGYLSILLSLGFVGLLIMSLFMLRSCRTATEGLKHDFYWSALWICLLFIVLIHNVTETSLVSMSNQLTATLVFMAACSSAAFASNEPTG